MENEKMILEHVIRRLNENKLTMLKTEAEILLRLLNNTKSYTWDEAIKAVTGREVESAE